MTAPVRVSLLFVAALLCVSCGPCSDKAMKARIVHSNEKYTVVQFEDGTRYSRYGWWGDPGEELMACKCESSFGERWWK